jgi:arginine repressor
MEDFCIMPNSGKESNVLKNENSDSNKGMGMKLLEGMFKTQRTWESQIAIQEALEKDGCRVSQPTLSRWLKEFGIVRNENKQYVLNEKRAHEKNLASFREAWSTMTAHSSDIFFNQVRVSILKTYPNYNVLMAEKIQQAFDENVLTIVCPNSTDIIIYTRRVKDEETEEQKPSKLNEEIRKLLKRQEKKSK